MTLSSFRAYLHKIVAGYGCIGWMARPKGESPFNRARLHQMHAKERPMRTRLAWILIVGVALVAAERARAQDVAAGKSIAQVSCSNCHLADPKEQKAGSDAVPTFSSIAQMTSTTEMSLAAFLSSPHGRMPDLVLSRTEIHDVSAYILSLRKLP
jgi:mono/diheme cytochrome c family protein